MIEERNKEKVDFFDTYNGGRIILIRKTKKSQKKIPKDFSLGLLDSKSKFIVSGRTVWLLTDSTRGSVFYGKKKAVVVGTSHFGRRVWLEHIVNNGKYTDREPENVLMCTEFCLIKTINNN